MPYLALVSNLKWTHDVNENYRQLWEMEDWDETKYDKKDTTLVLTRGDAVPDVAGPGNKKLVKYVHRGHKELEKGTWSEKPVFRVLVEDFTPREQIRFFERYLKVDEYGPHDVAYEPSLYDIQKTTVGATAGFDLPMWMLDYMMAHRFVERTEKQIKLPGVPSVDEDDFAGSLEITNEFWRIYKDRKHEEKGAMYKDYIKDMDEELVKRLKALDIEGCEERNLGLDTDPDLKEALGDLELA